MKGYHTNIGTDTLENSNFRKVIYTGNNLQLVLMNLKPGEEIGLEVHQDVDQFFRFEKGEGKVIIDGETFIVKEEDAVIVPAGSEHNIINSSDKSELKLYTIYSPPNHPEGTIHPTKEAADKAESEKHT